MLRAAGSALGVVEPRLQSALLGACSRLGIGWVVVVSGF
jgi:hypothetical protein